MNSIKAVASLLITESQKTSSQQTVDKLDQYLRSRNLLHWWPLIDRDLARRQSVSKTAEQVTIATASPDTSTTAAAEYFATELATDQADVGITTDTDLIAGLVVEGSSGRLDLSLQKQLQKLHHSLT